MCMQGAIDEINRRRKIQEAYNKKHHITPSAITKNIREWEFSKKEEVEAEFGPAQDKKLLEKEMKIRILSVLVVLMSLTSCIKKQVEGVQVVDIAAYEQQLKHVI